MYFVKLLEENSMFGLIQWRITDVTYGIECVVDSVAMFPTP